jgi:hypothetical protein
MGVAISRQLVQCLSAASDNATGSSSIDQLLLEDPEVSSPLYSMTCAYRTIVCEMSQLGVGYFNQEVATENTSWAPWFEVLTETSNVECENRIRGAHYRQ